MAELPFLLGFVIQDQTVRGTPEIIPTVGGGTGPNGEITEADGAVLGAPGSGVGDTGINVALSRNYADKAPQSGSFTRDFSNRIGTNVETLDMTIPMKGNGNARPASPVGADFIPAPGIVDLLECLGWAGSAGASSYDFVPQPTDFKTVGVYYGYGDTAGQQGNRLRMVDVEALGGEFSFTPGEFATLTVNMGGGFDSWAVGDWPTPPNSPFDYGNQSTLSAPAVENAKFRWGPGTPADRALGFSECTVTIENEPQQIQASNLAGGVRQRQVDRFIRFTGTIDIVDTEIAWEIQQLEEEAIGNAAELSFQIGEVGATGDPINAIAFSLPTVEAINLTQPDPRGSTQDWTVEVLARAATANGEATISFV